MGKTTTNLYNQLHNAEYKKEAIDCIKIYNKLKEMNNGHVWESTWDRLVTNTFIGYNRKIYKPTSAGYVFLKELE